MRHSPGVGPQLLRSRRAPEDAAPSDRYRLEFVVAVGVCSETWEAGGATLLGRPAPGEPPPSQE